MELWAEFVNNTADVYTHFSLFFLKSKNPIFLAKKLENEQPDVLHVFPSFNDIQPDLEHHRLDMVGSLSIVFFLKNLAF